MSHATSSLGINDTQPRNLEAPRCVDLLPDQIQSVATEFVELLTEYYKYMNINEWTTSTVSLSTYTVTSATGTVLTGESGSGPSNVIYSILSQLDVDQVNEDYLTHIQSAVAPYVPVPSYMSTTSTYTVNAAPYYKYLSGRERSYLRAQLYRKIIKYFYNTRGSRNSAITFFKLFYNDLASLYDWQDYPSVVENYITRWLTLSGVPIAVTSVSAGATVYGQTPVQAWAPFTYVITTGLTGQTETYSLPSAADIPFRALVHPVGFKYFIQPTGVSGIALAVSDGRMTNARIDYQEAFWFNDSTQLREFSNFTIFDAATPKYNDAFRNAGTSLAPTYTYADWSNLGSHTKFTVSLSGAAIYETYTLSVGTYSCHNIISGMLVTGTTSFTNYYQLNTLSSSATVAYLSSSVNTVSGIITLLTSLSSTIPSGYYLTFSPGPYKYP